MKTLFDLREDSTNNTIELIKNSFNEPLKIVKIEKESIKPCVGCWSCWLKTPGNCIFKDRMSEIYYDYINSDAVVVLMDTTQGFINHHAKAFLDRTIPHYMPYIEIIDGECRHMSRYKSYPDLYFLYNNECLTLDEDQIIEDYLFRTACHFKSESYRITIDDGIKIKYLNQRDAKNYKLEFSKTNSIDKLIIYNGSPRRISSNSKLVLDYAVKIMGERIEVRDLKETEKWNSWAQSFSNEKNVMFFMPLYVHAMPSHVMNFIEKLGASKGTISFFVQSGFPESSQSHYLEAYFEQLSNRLGREYIGTAIKGGLEGLQRMNINQQEKVILKLVENIKDLIENGCFNQNNIKQLGNPVRYDFLTLIVLRMLIKLGLINLFWDKQLKANQAFEYRYKTPFNIE